MKLFEKEGWIYYAQADHLSGEEIGTAIEALYEAGASNVQVISTITKKNRPGYIFMTDVRPVCRNQVEEALILETGVTGWHCIPTRHRHLAVDYLKKRVTIHYASEYFTLELEVKKAYGVETTFRPEHRSCLALKKKLEQCGKKIGIRTCQAVIRQIFEDDLEEYNMEETEYGE